LDTTRINNGSYNLKVIAIDEAGNQAEKTVNITIENLLTEEQLRIKAVNDAKNKKIVVEDLIKYYFDKGLRLTSELLNDKQRADDLLKEAEETINDNVARTRAETAKEIYDNINDKTVFTNIESENYAYEKENVVLLLSSIGLTQEQLEKATNNIVNSNIQRKLTILKIGEEHRVQIELNFDLNEGTYKIIEIIPKELVESAKNIFSNKEFVIIEDDPTIEFLVQNGEKIYYSFSVSEEQANKIIEDNMIGLYKTPPIILESQEELNITKEDGLLIIGLILIIIVIGLIIGFLIKNNKISFLENNKKDFGKNNPIGKIKGLVKPKEKKKNWKYKG
jgi:hypothetical protein